MAGPVTSKMINTTDSSNFEVLNVKTLRPRMLDKNNLIYLLTIVFHIIALANILVLYHNDSQNSIKSLRKVYC